MLVQPAFAVSLLGELTLFLLSWIPSAVAVVAAGRSQLSWIPSAVAVYTAQLVGIPLRFRTMLGTAPALEIPPASARTYTGGYSGSMLSHC